MDNTALMLLDCLRQESRADKAERLKPFSDDNWAAILEMAGRHKVLSILYSSLKDYELSSQIPAEVLNVLQAYYYSCAARNIRLYNQLLQLISALNNRGIEVIALKGAHLAEIVYGNIALRPMSDIDLLAKREDLLSIHDILVEEGYLSNEEKALSNTKHLAPYRRGKGVAIEIHFQITDPPYVNKIDAQGLWERSQVHLVENTAIRVLCPEDLLLHTCLHAGIQHGFDFGLLSVFDAAKILNCYREEMKWEELWNRAEEWGIERAVYLMAALSAGMLGVELPELIVRKGSQVKDASMAIKAAEEIIFTGGAGGTTRYLARLFGKQSWRTKLNYIKERTFPPPEMLFEGEYAQHNQHIFKRLLVYGRRITDLIRRHGKTVLRGLRRDPLTRSEFDEQNERNRLRDWMTGVE